MTVITAAKIGVDLFATHRRRLWTRMRLRTSESDKLVLLVAKAAEDIKGLRAASSRKAGGNHSPVPAHLAG